MKATDLLQLVNEKDDGAMGSVSYKNDHTPDNHVKNKKSKEVNPLPDSGKKRDERNPANIGDIKKKERRSMEGPGTGFKKMSEAKRKKGLKEQQTPMQQRMEKYVVKLMDPQTGEITVVDARNRNQPVNKYLKTTPQNVIKVQKAFKSGSDHQIAGVLKSIWDNPQTQTLRSDMTRPQQGSQVAGRTSGHVRSAQTMTPQQISSAGSGWAIESTDNAGSMTKKQPVKQGGPVSKTASVRSAKQNDEPKPTAKVGSPKKKERRSMDSNPVTVKDFKGGENEHKKIGVHEHISDLEKLLGRKIDTSFLN